MRWWREDENNEWSKVKVSGSEEESRRRQQSEVKERGRSTCWRNVDVKEGLKKKRDERERMW